MLQRFSVKNFKNFKNEFVWDLSAGKYNFNSESILLNDDKRIRIG